jgi:hypothetical protein
MIHIIDLKVLDRAYPEIIEFIELEGVFGPEIIDEYQKRKFHVYWFSGDRFSS